MEIYRKWLVLVCLHQSLLDFYKQCAFLSFPHEKDLNK